MQLLFGFLKKTVMLPYNVAYGVVAKVVGYENVDFVMKYAVFVFGGTIGLGIKAGFTYLFASVFGLWQMLAYSVGLILNIVFNFVFHRHITFNVKTNWEKRFAIFAVLTLVLVVVDWLLVYVFAELLRNNIYVTMFFVTLVLSILNFTINKLFVFRQTQAASATAASVTRDE